MSLDESSLKVNIKENCAAENAALSKATHYSRNFENRLSPTLGPDFFLKFKISLRGYFLQKRSVINNNKKKGYLKGRECDAHEIWKNVLRRDRKPCFQVSVDFYTTKIDFNLSSTQTKRVKHQQTVLSFQKLKHFPFFLGSNIVIFSF